MRRAAAPRPGVQCSAPFVSPGPAAAATVSGGRDGSARSVSRYRRNTAPAETTPIAPAIASSAGAPHSWATVPVNSAPAGVIPPITRAYIDITRPRRWSGAVTWRVVLAVAVNATMLAPAAARTTAATPNRAEPARIKFMHPRRAAPPYIMAACGPRWLTDAT